MKFGVLVSVLRFMGYTRQSMHHVAIQRYDILKEIYGSNIYV